METSDLKKIIVQIATSKITFDESTKNFLFNGENPRSVNVSFYSDLLHKFDLILKNDLKRNVSSIDNLKFLLETAEIKIKESKKIGEQHRVNYLFDKSKNRLSDDATYTHEDLEARLNTIKTVLTKIRTLLKNGIKQLEMFLPDEGKTDRFLIPFKPVERATFKLPKLEALMLLYILEANNLLAFENEAQRNRFIEANFNFTEERNNSNKGKAISLKTVNIDFANFKSFKHYHENTDTLASLLKKFEIFKEYKFKKR
jgi:hypothetical protein